MPAAQVGPPVDEEFSYVIEYVGQGFNPDHARFIHSYAETPKATRKVFLGGKYRALAFVTTAAMRNRALRLYWKDRTAEFGREWRRGDDGKWARIETPPMITTNGAGHTPPDGDDARLAVLLGLPVKEMVDALKTGAYDPLVKRALEIERMGKNRAGAVSALAARYGSMSPS